MVTSIDIIRKIESKIYFLRGEKVMLDEDLAELYGVLTKRLNEQVSRNINRFPSDFAFRLTNQELKDLKSQFATSSLSHGGRRKPPMAFSEHGITMLSSVLHSPRAVDVNIAIVRTFVRLRALLHSNPTLEKKILELESKYDGQFKVVFDTLKALILPNAISNKRPIGFGNNQK